jgi:hypothetical protein
MESFMNFSVAGAQSLADGFNHPGHCPENQANNIDPVLMQPFVQ